MMGVAAIAACGQEGGAGFAARLRAGDRGAVAEMVRGHGPRIGRLVYRLAGWDRGEAEDLVQETFARAVRGVRGFDGRSTVETWLTRIAINVCREAGRRREVRTFWWRMVRRGWWGAGKAEDRGVGEDVAGAVWGAVGRLRGACREVIVLRYLEEMEIEEICGVTGLKRSTVEVRLHRGREALRGMLGEFGGDQARGPRGALGEREGVEHE